MHPILQVFLIFFGVALYHQSLLSGQGGGLGIDAALAGKPSDHVETRNFVEKSIIWIQDEADEQCLGPHGFGFCGDANMWRVWYEGGSLLRFEHVNSVDAHEFPRDLAQSHCLSRYFSWRGDSKIGLSRCKSLPLVASSKWGVTADGFLVNTHLGAENCLFRFGGAVRADSCSRRHSNRPVLKPILHSLPATESVAIRAVSEPASSGLRCPNTDLEFPDTLYVDSASMVVGNGAEVVRVTEPRPAPQWDALAFIAMGTYFKAYFGVTINVYTVALYMRNDWALVDPIVSKYNGVNVSSGEVSALFVADLLQDVSYDRAVFIQLAMTLSKSTLVKGLVDDLPMKDENKELVMEAANKYTSTTCDRGLTLTIIWRGTGHTVCPGCLDVVINGVLLDSIASPGLGQDFFTQFVSDDPVSVHAKQAFLDAYSRRFADTS